MSKVATKHNDLKEKLVSSFLAFEETVDIDSPIHDIRIEAIKAFENQGFPTKRLEAWKYTSLNSILKHNYSVFPKVENALEYPKVKKYFVHDIDSYKIVFVDGKYSSHLSETTHDGIDVCLMSAASPPSVVRPHWSLFDSGVGNEDEV